MRKAKSKGKQHKNGRGAVVFGFAYRVMSGIYGMIGIVIAAVAVIAVNEVEGDFARTIDGVSFFVKGIENPITWLIFVCFALIAAGFWLVTRGEKSNTANFDDMVMQDEIGVANMENVAKELWVPINAVADCGVDMLLEGEDRMKGRIANLVEANEVISSVVNELVDFSMIASHRMRVVSKPYRVYDMIKGMHDAIAADFQKKGLAFKVKCDPHIPAMLVGDSARLSQIVNTILKNALKYTDEGSVSLRIGLEPMFAGDIGLVITVKDTGRGMSKETCDNLFNSYQTASSGREAGFVGTGLGMAIVKRLLELMKGTVAVHSEVGVGSEFCIRIPQGVYDVAEIGEITF